MSEMKHPRMAARLFSGSLALVTAAALASCQGQRAPAAPVPLHPAPLAAALEAQGEASSAYGSATLRVAFSEPKYEAPGGDRRVQSIDLAKAMDIHAYVTGAGINGWQRLSDSAFGQPDANGLRTATFSGNVAAGQRRVFKVDIKDSTSSWDYQVIESLYGVADISAGQTTTVTLSRATTPVGQIFRTLLATKDAARALTIPVADVQAFVDKLLNTNSATGAALDGTKPQINYSLLNVDVAASAIAIGANGTPYTVPPTVPASMVPTPVRKGQVTVKVVDVKGQPVTNESVVFLNDPASPVLRTAQGDPLDVTFPDVTPGAWTATAVDTVSGRTVTKTFSVGQSRSSVVSVMMPVQSIETFVGAYNLDRDGGCWPNYGCGFNGDDLHPAMIRLYDPRRVAIHGGSLYLVDLTNQRIRAVDLNSNTPVVRTVAGNGEAASAAAADGSNADQVPIGITTDCHMTFDENGDMLFSEGNVGRIAKIDQATGQITTLVRMADLPGVDATWSPTVLAYDTTRKTLFATVTKRWSAPKLFKIDMTTFPDPGSVTTMESNYYSHGMTVSGDYLFYSGAGYQIRRRSLIDDTEVAITGKNRLNNNVDGSPAQDYYQTDRWGSNQPYSDMVVDPQGNLYCFGGSGAMRVTKVLTGADGANDWMVNFLNFSGSGLTADAASGNLFFSGLGTVPDPNGSGNVQIHAVNVVRL